MKINPDEVKADLAFNKKDAIFEVSKAGISIIPFMGGPAVTILNTIIPTISDRQKNWIIKLSEGLQELENRIDSFNLENLENNETFITIFMQASQIAVRNHRNEKLEVLRNIVLNSALPNAPEDDLQLMFLLNIDSFTTWHIKILMLFDSPRDYAQEKGRPYPDGFGGGIPSAIEHVFPELRGRNEFSKQIWNDLYNKGLLNTPGSSFNTMMSGPGTLDSRTSDMGRDFIEFIKSPLD